MAHHGDDDDGGGMGREADSARLVRALNQAFDSVRLVDSGAGATRALILREARAIARASGGAFDPALRGHFDAIARGYALDRAALALGGRGGRGGRGRVADSALLDIGGQYRWISRRHTARMVGIADPTHSLSVLALVELRGGSASTAAQALPPDDIRDPRTGRAPPPARARAVTVLAPTATAAAAWSTAFFVLGCDSALALAARLKAWRLSVVCADSAGVRWTPELEKRVALPTVPGGPAP